MTSRKAFPVSMIPRGSSCYKTSEVKMRVYLLLWVMVLITACGQLSTKNSSLISQTSNETIPFRFVVGGWIVPQNYNPEDDPFANELQTTVIRNNNELRQFLGNIEILRLRGSIETLHTVSYTHLTLPTKA